MLLDMLAHLGLVFQLIDRQHDKPLVAKLVVRRLHRRHFRRAGLAPGSPEIDQNDFTPMLTQALRLAL